MESKSRRKLLLSGISLVSMSLAGCSTPPSSDGTPKQDSETERQNQDSETERPSQDSETESTVQASIEDLNPTATVVTQESNESPAEVELALKNTLSVPISVYPSGLGTYALEYIRPLNGETGEIMLYPRDTYRVKLAQGEFPDNPVEGCWRVIDTSEEGEKGPYLIGQDAPKEVEIKPDETYSVLHRAYYLGPDSHCFPADSYKRTTEIGIGKEERTPVDLSYILEVTSEGHFEASVEYDE